jgi:Undecaprenyl-phosphate galactose phosphotransferase WbaP
VIRPGLATGVALAASDLAALVLAFAIGIAVRQVFGSDLTLGQYLALLPLAGLFLAAYGVAGLYPGIPYHAAEELRRLSGATTLVCLLLGSATFFARGDLPPRTLLAGTWLAALVLVPTLRAMVRARCARRSWWGVPAILFGAGRTGALVVAELRRRPEVGYKVCAALDDDVATHGTLGDVPVPGGLDQADRVRQQSGATHVLVAMPGVPQERLLSVLTERAAGFGHIVILPVLHGMPTLWVQARDLGGVLGLEVRQNLLLPGPRAIKRLSDIILVLPLLAGTGLVALGLLLLNPLFNRGPLFYAQPRMGRGGREFPCWKFRTMRPDADAVLGDYLAAHPELKAEWEANHKLKDDPRVTRLGAFLRRYSVDELPQLWNVLSGQMSLVGPRPIVRAEIDKYLGAYDLYCQVRPGCSGLWQVSGRSDTSYGQRVMLDTYYVRNWSVWLDLVIIAKTPYAAVAGKGAY